MIVSAVLAAPEYVALRRYLLGMFVNPICIVRIQWKGPGAESEEKREPVSDIDTAVADSLKVLDLKRPIREADIKVRNIADGVPPTIINR